jgi:ABC-type oligopeptide transport system substrate-binding subunit
MKKIITIFGTIIFASIILASCGGNSSKEQTTTTIEGKYVCIKPNNQSSNYLIINKDGSITNNVPGSYGGLNKGTYSVSGNKLNAKLNTNYGPIDITYIIDGDRLSVTGGGNIYEKE